MYQNRKQIILLRTSKELNWHTDGEEKSVEWKYDKSREKVASVMCNRITYEAPVHVQSFAPLCHISNANKYYLCRNKCVHLSVDGKGMNLSSIYTNEWLSLHSLTIYMLTHSENTRLWFLYFQQFICILVNTL
jgi:hypothetical protein